MPRRRTSVINASDLNWQQAALLAGMVQSTSTLNPYTNPDGALARRNLVLDTMIDNLPEQADALRAAKAEPLGILPQPNELPRGCIAAGDRAFFCDYVQEYLARAGISKEQVARGGYLIRTTLDPEVQDPVKSAIDSIASPTLEGIASVMSVIKPGKDSHKVMAMASNRTYGLNSEAGETMRPQPFSLVGDGAGSIFKIFTTAAAMRDGHGHQRSTRGAGPVPGQGHGQRRRKGLPEGDVVRHQRRQLPRVDECDRRAGHVAQHGVRPADPAGRGAARGRHGGQARTAVLRRCPERARDYDPESNESLADFIKRQNIGSFTLGPIELNALELSNVAATLASGGVWCPPSPIDKLIDRNGNEVRRHHRGLRPGGSRGAGQHAGQRDEQGRPGRRHRVRVGRRGGVEPAGVRQDRHHRGAPVVGIRRLHQVTTPRPTTSTTTRTSPSDLCSSPLRQCGDGNLYGGNEPARTWFTAMKPIATDFGDVKLPPTDPRVRRRRRRFSGAERRGSRCRRRARSA